MQKSNTLRETVDLKKSERHATKRQLRRRFGEGVRGGEKHHEAAAAVVLKSQWDLQRR
jgi:hypothetical protein